MCEASSSTDSSSDEISGSGSGSGSGSDTSDASFAPSVEDACGAGVFVADLNSTEYVGLFSDTIGLLNNDEVGSNNENGSTFAAVIPAEDIDSKCEVRCMMHFGAFACETA